MPARSGPDYSMLSPGAAGEAERRERRRVARRRALPIIAAGIALVGIPVLLVLLLGSPSGQNPTGIPDAAPTNFTPMRSAVTVGFLVALLALGWLVAGVTLVLDGRRLLRDRRRRRGVACPHCGMREGALTFARQVIAGTGWEELTCPQCRKVWHLRL